jgi:hypothetical protein
VTNDELQAHISALNQAAADGEIEWNVLGNVWEPLARTFINYAYRIKPKPREVWVLEFGDGSFRAYSIDDAPPAISVGSRLTRFREVIE